MGNTFRGGRDQPHRKAIIRVGESKKDLPALSIQCFERRHTECDGGVGFWVKGDEPCECKCHGPLTTQQGTEKDG